MYMDAYASGLYTTFLVQDHCKCFLPFTC